MKKVVFFFFLTIITLGTGWAIDFGLSIYNTSILTTDPNNIFYQENKAALWFVFDLNERIFFYLNGFYKFDINDPHHSFGLDQAEFRAEFPIMQQNPFLFKVSLGRILAKDFSGFIFAHPLDGLCFGYHNAFMNFALTGGYTGLIFKGESNLVMSIEDQNYQPEVPLVPPRLVGILSVDFPELIAYQTLYLSVVGQIDLHPEENLITEGTGVIDLENGGRIDTLYTGLGISGPLFENFYWSFVFYFEFGRTLSYFDLRYQYIPIYSFFSALSFDWFFPEFKKSKLMLNVFLASGDREYLSYLEGDTDEFSTQFIPITRPALGLVYPLQLTNSIIIQLSYSLKPFSSEKPGLGDNFITEIVLLTFFRAAQSDVSNSAGLNSGSAQYYLGNEIDLIITFRPLADLGLKLALGLFLPNNYTSEAAFSPDGRGLDFLARLNFRLDF